MLYLCPITVFALLANHACSHSRLVIEYAAMRRIFFIGLGLACICCSCSVKRHLTRAEARVEGMYAQTENWDRVPVRSITWDQAVSILMRHNVSVLEVEDQIRQAERDSLSVYTEMVPGLSYYSYITRSLSKLTTPVNADEMNHSVNVTFGMPALTQIPYRLYSAKVRTISAMKAKEGRCREAISRLYKLVREREVDTRLRALEQKAPEEMKNSDRFGGVMQRDQDEQYWRGIAKQLGRSDARWNILPESMPHIVWQQYQNRLDRLSELVACQYAMRLEQARMAQYNVALNYLPTINTSIYSPSLFSSSGGIYQGAFLDMDDTRINLSISYTVDTKLYNWYNYKQSKDRYEREKLKLVDEMIDHRARIQKIRSSMDEYHHWRNFMLKHIDYLNAKKITTAEEYIERAKGIYGMRRELLEQEKKSIESEAAIVLEYGMPNESAP